MAVEIGALNDGCDMNTVLLECILNYIILSVQEYFLFFQLKKIMVIYLIVR